MLNREILHTRTKVCPARFTKTSWTAVSAAGNSDTPEGQNALTQLCQSYWPPLFAYVRRLGYNQEDARDLTQQFFYVLLSKNYLGAADRQKGKFRTFLLTALRHFLANEHDRATAQKRGSGKPLISLDAVAADEEGPAFEPADNSVSPVKLFEQRWARTLFQKALERLAREQEDAGKGASFSVMKAFLAETTPPGGYEEAAGQLDLPVNTLRVSVYRLRKRLAELVRWEVADTLVNPDEEEIEAEVQHLFDVFST